MSAEQLEKTEIPNFNENVLPSEHIASLSNFINGMHFIFKLFLLSTGCKINTCLGLPLPDK